MLFGQFRATRLGEPKQRLELFIRKRIAFRGGLDFHQSALARYDKISVRLGCRVFLIIEIKRRGGIDGVEQLTRYLELMNRDPLLAPVAGVFAAQEITPQARTLAEDRGIRCLLLDYDAMRGLDDGVPRLF